MLTEERLPWPLGALHAKLAGSNDDKSGHLDLFVCGCTLLLVTFSDAECDVGGYVLVLWEQEEWVDISRTHTQQVHHLSHPDNNMKYHEVSYCLFLMTLDQ